MRRAKLQRRRVAPADEAGCNHRNPSSEKSFKLTIGRKRMLKFYYSAAPNPTKVALFLEESGLPYEAIPVDTRKGEQHKPDYLKINPNAKVPAIVDGDAVVFDSNAILLYLGEKTGKFVPANTPKLRGEMLSWLMFVASGVGPYSGQAVHFRNYAPEKLPYAINRYVYEGQRHFGILDARLAKQHYMVGDSYTIVDMDVWGWARLVPAVLGEGAWAKFPSLKRLVDEVSARPAAARAIALKDRHTWKAEMDEEARHAMFGHLKEKVA
jgi:GST-like protein